MNKYRYGLRGDIAHAVSLQNIVNFGDLIQKAYSAEATIDFANKERAAVNQQKKDFWEPGHMRNECPKWKSLGGAEGTTVSKGRVYTIDG
ncbi:hypothetical protein A2U01_0041961 [Trifolium medium]|uniref:Uncharacterized protein n=1 Tax=Trifolium medium TaxID=97028 RepID=A0A392Q9J1_9FABA|nr:hypothetical protein [Trifolium medium]